jgi:hypothetical protein
MNPEQELEQLEALLQELLNGIQDTLMSGETLSDEFQGMLADELEYTTSRIDQLRDVISNAPAANGEAPSPVGTDLLWILSGGDVNAFINYLRSFPGEGLQQLASNPNRLAQVIQHLQQNNPINPNPGIGSDGIPNTALQSSNVAGMRYDPRSGRLLVKFHGEGRDPVYQYDSVPPQIFDILQHGNAFAQTKGKNRWGEWWPMKNPSLGAAVNQYLKAGGYNYRRLR